MSIAEIVWPDGQPVSKSNVRSDDKIGHRRTMMSVDDVRNADLTGQFGGIYVRSIRAFFDIDTGNLDPDDGANVIIDRAGNHFVRLSLSAGSVDVTADYAWTGLHTFAKGISISPAAASTDKGISISQSGPLSGSGSSFNYNTITVNGDNYNVSGNNNALNVAFKFGGPNMQGQRVAIRGVASLTDASSLSNDAGNAYAGMSGEFQCQSDDGGIDLATGAKGTGIGIYGSATASSGAVNLNRMTPLELNLGLRNGSSAKYAFGCQITQWHDHAVSGSSLDAAIYVGNQSGAAGWKNFGIVFDSTIDGVGTCFQPTATILGTKGDISVANGIDFSSASISGDVFKSFAFHVTGGGTVGIGKAGSASGNIFFAGVTSGATKLTCADAAGGTLTLPAATDTLVGQATADFLTNKTGLIVGSSAGIAMNSESGAAFTPAVQINSTGAGATIGITRWTANANQGRFAFGKSRGASIGTRGAVQSGDSLGTFVFDGDDGTNFATGAAISARVNGTVATGAMPSDLVFSTSQSGNQVPTEWMVLRSHGSLDLAGAIRFTSASTIVANGTVATALSSLGPTGSHTTAQEWLAVVNASNVTRYIPMF